MVLSNCNHSSLNNMRPNRPSLPESPPTLPDRAGPTTTAPRCPLRGLCVAYRQPCSVTTDTTALAASCLSRAPTAAPSAGSG